MPGHLSRAQKARQAATARIFCTQEENRVRPEWRDENDIKQIVDRVQRGATISQRPLGFGSADYTMDRDGMFAAARELEERYLELPPDIRAKLTRDQFLNRALQLQSIDADQLETALNPPPPAPGEPAPPGAEQTP